MSRNSKDLLHYFASAHLPQIEDGCMRLTLDWSYLLPPRVKHNLEIVNDCCELSIDNHAIDQSVFQHHRLKFLCQLSLLLGELPPDITVVLAPEREEMRLVLLDKFVELVL
jgi:hypothetical protein